MSSEIPVEMDLKEPLRAFFIVFLLIIRVKKKYFFSRSYIISSTYVLAVGNTPYGKWHASRTEPP